MHRIRLLSPLLFLLIFTLLALSVPTVTAQREVTDDEVNRVASQLFCPTCEAIPVDVCPTQVCSDWREEIRKQLAAGRSEAEILDDFALRYGSGVLATPPPRGFGLYVYVVPILVGIGGVFIFYRQMRQLQNAGNKNVEQRQDLVTDTEDEPATEAIDSYRQRIEDALK